MLTCIGFCVFSGNWFKFEWKFDRILRPLGNFISFVASHFTYFFIFLPTNRFCSSSLTTLIKKKYCLIPCSIFVSLFTISHVKNFGARRGRKRRETKWQMMLVSTDLQKVKVVVALWKLLQLRVAPLQLADFLLQLFNHGFVLVLWFPELLLDVVL